MRNYEKQRLKDAKAAAKKAEPKTPKAPRKPKATKPVTITGLPEATAINHLTDEQKVAAGIPVENPPKAD